MSLQDVAVQALRCPIPGFGFELIQSSSVNENVLRSTSTRDLYTDLARSGVVIYRNFADTLDDFNQFVSKHSARVTFDPARTPSTSNTAEIAAGRLEMGLHRENGNLPFSPDIQWFYCLQQASRGSQTTFCDGSRVLRELSPATRKAFERRKIKYARRIPWTNVKRYLSVELRIPEAEIDDTHLQLVNEEVEGQTYRRLDDNLIYSERETDAIIVSAFSGKRAFCNSLLGPSVNYEPPTISWADGEDIDFAIWDEIKEVTERLTYELFWSHGDIVVVDNSRVMHGRRRLDDSARRIFGAQSYRKGDIA